MTFWALFLRAIGTAIFLLGTAANVIRAYFYPHLLQTWEDVFQFAFITLISVTLAALCFALAAGLIHLQRLEERIARAASRRRVASQQSIKDLAPVAPNWDDLPDPLPYGNGAERRFARQKRMGTNDPAAFYAIGEPEIRRAPRAIRTTPGTENQYAPDNEMDERLPNPPPAPYDRRAHGKGYVDRSILQRGRDAAIRRAQAAQSKKR